MAGQEVKSKILCKFIAINKSTKTQVKSATGHRQARCRSFKKNKRL